ncbi:MAG: septum formation initiator family protein [Verrucomicrobiota bacterium]
MTVEDSIWDKLTRVVIGLLLIAGLAGIGVWYLPLIKQNERMRRRVMELDLQVQKELETKKQLSASIEAMNNDPKAVERLAREKLGYAKPGETVIKFGETSTNRTIQ